VVVTEYFNTDELSADSQELIRRMDALATEKSLRVVQRPSGRVYLPQMLEPVPNAGSGEGVYFRSSRGVEINLSVFKAYGEINIVNDLVAALQRTTSTAASREYPKIPLSNVLRNWEAVKSEVLIPYFEARIAHAAKVPNNTETRDTPEP
jgi:hypothetical protein